MESISRFFSSIGQFPAGTALALLSNLKHRFDDTYRAGLPSEAADSNVILWQANVPAGTYAW